MAFKEFSVYLNGLHIVYLLNPSHRFEFRMLKRPRMIVLHDTGPIPLTIEDYYEKSVSELGQPKTHFVITDTGRIYQTLPINVCGNHVRKRNDISIGVSLHNLIPSKPMSSAMRYSLYKLRDALSVEFGSLKVKTHRELLVDDVRELTDRLGISSDIDFTSLLTLTGSELENYKHRLVDWVRDNLDEPLYTEMLIERIDEVVECPGGYPTYSSIIGSQL